MCTAQRNVSTAPPAAVASLFVRTPPTIKQGCTRKFSNSPPLPSPRHRYWVPKIGAQSPALCDRASSA